MKVINLIKQDQDGSCKQDQSAVKYDITVFPDGEPHIKFTEELDRKDNYRVISRISNPNDLFIVSQVGNILKRQGVCYELILTYLMSMRMDRVINFNEAFSLEIVADIINNMGAEKVYIFECHSERAFKLIKNSESIDLLKGIQEYNVFLTTKVYDLNNAICFPDHGAYERYQSSYTNNPRKICMNKNRDLEHKGVIKSMNIELYTPGEQYDEITIIDDLCDGGGTFCWAASLLKEKYGSDVKINIFVKHMVNLLGLIKLAGIFDNVYITDSYKDWTNEINDNNLTNVKVFKVTE